MPRMASGSRTRQVLTSLLCFLISPLPGLCAPPQGQKAGEVGALRPDATRNEQVLKVKDELQWNDFLKTLQTGRLRAQLLDGSQEEDPGDRGHHRRHPDSHHRRAHE